MTNPWGPIAEGNYLSLTTFKKDGTGVPTPIWFAADGDKLVVWTVTDSWKVKRAKRNPEVTVQACDLRGKVSGEVVKGRAEVLDGAATAEVRAKLRKKYGLLGRLTIDGSILRRGKSGTVGIAISPAAS